MFKTAEAVKRPLKLFTAFYILSVLFGAPLWSDFQATLLLSSLLTICTGLPLVVIYKNDYQLFDLLCNFSCIKYSEHLALGAVYGSLIGCYISGFVIPLDWDRPWQKYSFPNCVGAVTGCFLGFVIAAESLHSPVNSPSATITPSSSSGSLISHGEGQFGKYRLGDIPKIEAIFFAVFDNKVGSRILYQERAEHVDQDQLKSFSDPFQSISAAIIPKPELLNRLVKINFDKIKIMGHPISLEHKDYERGKFSFNMCFVVAKSSTIDCMYEPLVQKLAEYLIELEMQSRFLSNTESQTRLPDIMRKVLDNLNSHGECVLPVKDNKGQIMTTIYLCLCPSYSGVEPPKVPSYMVPMLIRDVNVSPDSHLVQKMDIPLQKIISNIDGIRCVKEIAALVSIDAEIVARYIRNLYFFECVSLVPLFLYQNCYVSTEKLHHFYTDKTGKIQECLEFVRLRNGNGDDDPIPAFHDVFRLYMNLTCGRTMITWCKEFEPRKYNVDERRLIQYGMYHNFVRKLSIFPVTTLAPDDKDRSKLHNLCDGTNALEDLAVLYSMPPDELYECLKNSQKFEFISK